MKNRPWLNVPVDVTRNSSVVPCVKTLFTSLSPYLTLRTVFSVGTAVINCEFGVAAMIFFSSSAYRTCITRRLR